MVPAPEWIRLLKELLPPPEFNVCKPEPLKSIVLPLALAVSEAIDQSPPTYKVVLAFCVRRPVPSRVATVRLVQAFVRVTVVTVVLPILTALAPCMVWLLVLKV